MTRGLSTKGSGGNPTGITVAFLQIGAHRHQKRQPCPEQVSNGSLGQTKEDVVNHDHAHHRDAALFREHPKRVLQRSPSQTTRGADAWLRGNGCARYRAPSTPRAASRSARPIKLVTASLVNGCAAQIATPNHQHTRAVGSIGILRA